MLVTRFDPFPFIETERLHLTKLEDKHAGRLHEMRTNPEVMRYLQRSRPGSMEDTLENIRNNQELIQKQDGISWVVELKGENLLAGVIGYWRMKKEYMRPEIGYLLLPQYWGKGIMSEAIRAIIRYGFEQMNAHTIEADINPENDASAKILERHGFVREGLFRENVFFEGEFSDSAIYSLLKRDWKNN